MHDDPTTSAPPADPSVPLTGADPAGGPDLSPAQARAVLALALMAAMADGRTGAEEREQLRGLFGALAGEHDLPDLPALYQDVLLRRTDATREAATLTTDAVRRMAFEMAVCVADADGRTTEAEQKFLDGLEKLLGLDHDQALAFEREADALADLDRRMADERLDADALLGVGVGAGAIGASVNTAANPPAQRAPREMAPPPPLGQADPVAKAVDSTILKYAILNGALELMPQNLATMAILPLQTRMVYVIGRHRGFALGAGHIKEFIATLGLGASGQMLENVARKALGSLAKKALGKTAGKVASAATGPMMTFATTYAIGKVADAYYAGGRKLGSVDLRSMFTRELERGKAAYDRHSGSIGRQAASLNPADVLRAVRGGGGGL
ncbi:MAG: TerB family tellurite resistance protein [Phycisphaerales bacterium]